MEKTQGSKSKEPAAEDLQKRDPDDLQWNRKQENIESTRNALQQNSLQGTEKSKESFAEEDGLKQGRDINLKQSVGGLADNSLARVQDLKQANQLKVNAINQECDKLSEDEILKPERNIRVQRIIKSPGIILFVPAQDSIPASKRESNDTTQQELDGNVKNEQIVANGVLQEENEIPKKLPISSSKAESFEQPCEVSEGNGKIKEEEYIITQQKSARPDKISETPTEAKATQYDTHDQEKMRREKELRKLIAGFFNKQNQVTLQQKIESPEEVATAPEQDSISTTEQDSNNAAQQELHRNAKSKQLEGKVALQQISELPRKISKISSKTKSFQESYEVSVDNVKDRQEQYLVKQRESAETDKVLETPTEAGTTQCDAKDQKMIKREQKPRLHMTFEELQELRKRYAQELAESSTKCRSESKDCSLARSQEPPEDAQDQEMMKRKQKQREMLADYCSKQNKVDSPKTEIGPRKFKHIDNLEETKPREHLTFEELQEIRKRYAQELAESSNKCRSEYEDGSLARSQEPPEDAQDQEMMKREQKQREMLTDYFSKQNKVDPPKTEIDPRKFKHSFDNLEETEPRLYITFEELQELRKRYAQELAESSTKCRSESEDGSLSRSQEPPEDAKDQEMMKREQKQRGMLTDYFSKQNKVDPPKTEIGHQKHKHSFNNLEETKPREHLTFKELQGIRNRYAHELAESSTKCRSESEDCSLARSQEPPENAQDQEMMKREQKQRGMLTDNFSKQNKVDPPKTEIGHQKHKHSFDNLEKTEPRLHITFEELQELRKRYAQELAESSTQCRSEYEDGSLARSQEPTADEKETKEWETPENGSAVFIRDHVKPEPPQLSKAYVTRHKPESDDIASGSHKPSDYFSGLLRGSNDSSKHHKKTKDYVTSFHRDCATACTSKTKDYVTLPSRTCISLSSLQEPSLEAKRYVTTHLPMLETTASYSIPPAHAFLPGPRFREHPFGLGLVTQMKVPPRPFQGPSTTAESQEPEPSRIPLGTQQLEDERESNRTRLCQALRLQGRRNRRVPEANGMPLVPCEEVSPDDSNEPRVQRNRGILRALMPPRSTGIHHNFLQRFYERHIPEERQGFFKKLITACILLFGSLLAGGILTVVLYFAIPLLLRQSDIVGLNVTSPLYSSRLILNIPVANIKYYRHSEAMDGKGNTPGTHLVDSNLTPSVVESDVNITNSWANLDAEIFSGENSLDNTANIPEITSESTMATLVTNLDVTLTHFDFGVTAPFNYFDVNLITPVTDLDSDINPVTDMNVNITIPVTDLSVNLTTCMRV